MRDTEGTTRHGTERESVFGTLGENGRGVPSPGTRLRWDGGCPRRTWRRRKTSTWGRGTRKDAARKGNFCRTRWVGEQEPTSLRGRANQVNVLPDTDLSHNREKLFCEGTLHAGICVGGAGWPAFLPRRRTAVFKVTSVQ